MKTKAPWVKAIEQNMMQDYDNLVSGNWTKITEPDISENDDVFQEGIIRVSFQSMINGQKHHCFAEFLDTEDESLFIKQSRMLARFMYSTLHPENCYLKE